MAHRPKDKQPFSDATEVELGKREDTAVDEPHTLDADPSTDVGTPPFAVPNDVSGLPTQADQAPLSAGDALPPEFDTAAPASEFADATVQLPTFGRGGETAPPSQFAEMTVPLEVQKSARRFTGGDQAAAHNVRRPAVQQSALPPPPVASSRPPSASAPKDAFDHLPSFEDDGEDIYAQPTEALTFREDVSFSRTGTPHLGTPAVLDRDLARLVPGGLPNEPQTDPIPPPRRLSDEPSTDQSAEGFPSSWIPNDAPPQLERRIPSQILAEAGQAVSRTEHAEMVMDGSPAPVSLPDGASVDGPPDAPPALGDEGPSLVVQETGTWNPGAHDSAFDPTANERPSSWTPVSPETPSPPVPPPSAPSTLGPTASASTDDVPLPPPLDAGRDGEPPAKKKGGCFMVAGAGCAFLAVVAVSVGGLFLWYQNNAGTDAVTAERTLLSADAPARPTPPTKETAAPGTNENVPTNADNDAPPSTPKETEPKLAAAFANADAPATNRNADADADADDDSVETKDGEAVGLPLSETDRKRSAIKRRGAGTYLFRATGGKRSLRYALTAAVRKELKASGLTLAKMPVRRGFDVALKVRGSRTEDDGEQLKIESDCRLTIREHPSGTLRRAIGATGVAKGPKAKRSDLSKQAVAQCGQDLARAAKPLLAGP